MARNENGEFELMLGNGQLMAVFFLMVILLGLCFGGGYMMGRSAAPVIEASNTQFGTPTPLTPSTPAKTTPTPEKEPAKEVAKAPVKEEPAPTPPPIRTAPQAPPETAVVEPSKSKSAPTPVAKAAKETALPTKAVTATKTPAKQGAVNGKPVAGRAYLQLTATDQVKAETIVDLLRSKKFSSIAAAVPNKDNLYRVLVGPIADGAVAEEKAKLKAAGFPADDAFKQVFK